MNNKLNNSTIQKTFKAIAVVLGIATAIYAIFFYITNCFGTDKTKNFNLYFAVIAMAIVVSMGYFVFHFLKEKEMNYPRMFVIIGLCWGICFQLVMPPFSGPDEESHFLNAYHASNTYLGLKDQNLGENWKQGETFFYMRAEDMETFEESEFSYPAAYYIITGGNIVRCKDATLVENYYYPANFYRYIFSGLGIAIGRLLGLGFIGVLLLGRLMNTLVYVFIGWATLKLLPLGRLQMVSYLLLPAVLELCNCYSYDNFSILFSMLLLALCLYYSKPEVEIRIIDIVALILCLAMVMPNKLVYATFIIWVFMIPFKKWKNWLFKKRDLKGTIAIIGLCVLTVAVAIFVVWKKLFHMVYHYLFEKAAGGSIEQSAGVESFSIGYIFRHPIKTLVFVVQGFAEDFWYNIKHVIGCELGDMHLNAPIPLWITLALLVILVFGILYCGRFGEHASKRQVILTVVGCVVCLGAIVVGCLVRFTPVDGTGRAQISWRYLVPFYMGLVVICGTKDEENKDVLSVPIMLVYAQNVILAFTALGLLKYLLG